MRTTRMVKIKYDETWDTVFYFKYDKEWVLEDHYVVDHANEEAPDEVTEEIEETDQWLDCLDLAWNTFD